MAEHRLPDTLFWAEPESIGPDSLRLSSEESHHLLNVHRARQGAPFQAIDGAGGFYECVLESVDRRIAVGRIVERRTDVGELSRPIEVLVGLPDWSGVEQVVAHGVPLGASAFDFFPCDRSERGSLGPQRHDRLLRIARAALKQSRRSRLPVLRTSGSIEGAVTASVGTLRLFADPDGNPAPAAGLQPTEGAISLVIGPPGGFTEKERRFLLDKDFSPISLGPSRLTTETAALALISLARNHL